MPNTIDPKTGRIMKGGKPWNFKGRYERSDGYIDVYMPDHPRTHGRSRTRQRYVFEHVLVMEKHLGRFLVPPENVHHINHIRDDNRLENLQLCANNAEHRHVHAAKYPDGTKRCAACGQTKPLDQFPFRKRPARSSIKKRFYGSWCYPCCQLKKRQLCAVSC